MRKAIWLLGTCLAVLGGLFLASSLMVALLGLFRQLEMESYAEQLLTALGGLVYALPAYGIYRLGRWMRKQGTEAKISVPEPSAPAEEKEQPLCQKWVFLGTGVPQDWERQPVSVLLWPHDDRIELFVRKGDDRSKAPDRLTEEYHLLPPDWLQGHDAHELSQLIWDQAGFEIKPDELVKKIPGLALGTPIRTIPADQQFTDVLLYQGPLGREQLGNQKLYLEMKRDHSWELHCVSFIKPSNHTHHDSRVVSEVFAPGGNIRPLLDAAMELTGVHLDPQKVRKRIRREPLLMCWDPQPKTDTFPVYMPPLSEAVESGSVGVGSRSQHRDDTGTVHTVNTSGDGVKYYFFEDGTLALVGRGPTRAVDQGGFDGRSYYEPEPAPFSERVLKQTRRVVAAQGVTNIGHGLLMRFDRIEELHLADSVQEVRYNQVYSLTVLRAGEDLRSVNLFTGKLRELVLPEGAVELVRHNSGSLLGIKTEDPKIKKLIDRKLELEFATTIRAIYRMYPQIAPKLTSIARYDPLFAAQTLFHLCWNSRVGSVMVELYPRLENLSGVSEAYWHDYEELKLNFSWEYGEHGINYAAALAHAAVVSGAKRIRCEFDRMRIWDEKMMDWWKAEFPETELVMTNVMD